MSPILGIWASQNYPRITNSYESIATVTVGAGGASSADFTSIPQTYKHLQLRWISNSNDANVRVNFNSDSSTSNYAFHLLRGSGSVATSAAYPSSSGNSTIFVNSGSYSGGSNIFGVGVVDILDYTNTNKYKVSRGLGGYESNNSSDSYITFQSSLWMNTSAITSISLISGTINQYSKFALYGIKGA